MQIDQKSIKRRKNQLQQTQWWNNDSEREMKPRHMIMKEQMIMEGASKSYKPKTIVIMIFIRFPCYFAKDLCLSDDYVLNGNRAISNQNQLT
jgi:hypothetical protein